MTSRTRYLLGAVGVGLLAFAALWFFIIFPELDKLHDDFSYTAEVISFDNFYDKETERFLGEQQSKTVFSYDVREILDGAITVANVFAVSTLTGDPIFSVERFYGINPYSREHAGGYGDRDRRGFLFAPRMKGLFAQVPDQAPFSYWHVNYNLSLNGEIREEEKLFGTTVYRYAANFSAEQTDELTGVLPEVGDTLGVTLDVSLELWIEPYTGYLVKYTDSAEAWYYSLETGERLHPWNKFGNSFADPAVQRHAERAATVSQELLLEGLLVPLSAALVAFLLWITALLYGRATLRRIPAGVQRLLIPGAVFVVTLAVTVSATQLVANDVERQIRSELEAETSTMIDAIEDRIGIYINGVMSARGFLLASSAVERNEWREYINALSIPVNYPGIQGIGYSIFIEPDELDAHVAAVRAEGFPEYTVRPEGNRDIYTSIIYIEPFNLRNQQAFGFDMYQEKNRQTAMNYARDFGEPAASKKVTLVQEIDNDVQAGLLLYVPYYGNGKEPTTIEERRDRIVGHTYAVFRMNDFMNGVFPALNPLIGVEVFDGVGTQALSTENRMFNSRDSLNAPTEAFDDTAVVVETAIANAPWTVVFTPSDEYGLNFVRAYAAIGTLITGLVLSILISLVVYFQATAQFRATQVAERLTKDLRESRDKLEGANKHAQTRLDELERMNKLMVGRELKMVELKKKLKEKS